MIENDTSLLQLDTRDVMSDDIVESIRTAEEIERANSECFITQRLVNRSCSLDAPIKKNKLQLLSSSNRKSNLSVKSEKKQLQKDVTMFAQMYIATQVRGGDIDELFSHETRKEPPALAKEGNIRGGNKSDLLQCLEMDKVAVASDPKVEAAAKTRQRNNISGIL